MNTRKEPAMATTPESFVDALNSAFGKQTTQRAAHAKGVVLLGKFVPSAEAASVSKALHFKHEVPVTVRFSANSGIPKIADADPRAAPRGLAIRFRLLDDSAKPATNYLDDEIRQRVTRGAVRFKVVLQLAAPGDKIDDPSVAWASTNKITTLGTLTVAPVVPDSEATERARMFLPALLPAGIEPADPMIQFRNKTYPVSYERRHQSQPV